MKASLRNTILSRQFSRKLRLSLIGLNVLFGKEVSLILSFDTIKVTKFELRVQIFRTFCYIFECRAHCNGIREGEKTRLEDARIWGRLLVLC